MASMCVRAPAPLDADQVKTYQNCLADGGAVAIDFAEPAHLEASRMALLLGGFALESNGTQLVATKLAPPKKAARRRRRAPPPVARVDGDDDDLVDEDALLAADGLEPPAVDEAAAKCAPRKPCENCTCGRKEQLEAEGDGVRPRRRRTRRAAATAARATPSAARPARTSASRPSRTPRRGPSSCST